MVRKSLSKLDHRGSEISTVFNTPEGRADHEGKKKN